MTRPGAALEPDERQIQAAILWEFGSHPRIRLWRQSSGLFLSPAGCRPVRAGIPGCADLSGILADGRRLEIEVKGPRGRQSARQRAFQKMIERFGGVYILARSAEDVRAGLEAAGFEL